MSPKKVLFQWGIHLTTIDFQGTAVSFPGSTPPECPHTSCDQSDLFPPTRLAQHFHGRLPGGVRDGRVLSIRKMVRMYTYIYI